MNQPGSNLNVEGYAVPIKKNTVVSFPLEPDFYTITEDSTVTDCSVGDLSFGVPGPGSGHRDGAWLVSAHYSHSIITASLPVRP